jgi:type VI secretion system secreted protein VgrG
MAKATQKGRILAIQTKMGEDFFLLNKVEGTEGISQLYTLDLEILHDSEKQINTPYLPDINSVLGQAATISLTQRDGGARYFNGIFNFFKMTGRTDTYSFYNATLVPQVWELTQVSQSRIFQQKSVPDILKEVFTGYQVKYELQWQYKPRNYCVQYDETDFDFASRLMEEEGICYFFEHSNTAETMVITDHFQQPRDCPEKSDLPIYDEQLDEGVGEETAIRHWFVEYKVQPGKVTLWDYHFQLPKKKLETQQVSRHNVAGNRELEIYKYPGGYARKYDGIDKSGGEQPSDLQNIFDDNQQMSKDQMEIWDSDFTSYYGDSDCGTMIPGFRFNLKNHPDSSYNAAYIITTVTQEINQQPNFLVELEYDEAYKNSFTCIPHGSGKPEYRPYQKTDKPKIFGTQTAIVVGPAGEEIFTDKYGRVKVQFHWDRLGKTNSDSSCWVRVAQSLAGNKWGAMFIPRIGMEVLVHFIGGDPDEPVITGCLYNPDTMPPYTLPDEKTKSTLKTNSSKGGGGFNEFRIEDKKGEEQIFLHGEKNLDIRIKNDAKEIIKRDRHLIVERDQMEKVKGDKHLTVTGNQNEKIDGSLSKKVGGSSQKKVSQKIAYDAGTEIHLKAGMSATIEAGTTLTLKVGGNFININSGGIFISGTMVMINSGGAAGSGSGSSPTAPKDPTEADTANPGDRIPPPQPPPPLPPRQRSQKSAAMKQAADFGTPFVALA